MRTYISRDICPHYILLRFSPLGTDVPAEKRRSTHQKRFEGRGVSITDHFASTHPTISPQSPVAMKRYTTRRSNKNRKIIYYFTGFSQNICLNILMIIELSIPHSVTTFQLTIKETRVSRFCGDFRKVLYTKGR